MIALRKASNFFAVALFPMFTIKTMKECRIVTQFVSVQIDGFVSNVTVKVASGQINKVEEKGKSCENNNDTTEGQVSEGVTFGSIGILGSGEGHD